MSIDNTTTATARDLYVDIEDDLVAALHVTDFLISRTVNGADITGRAVTGLHYILGHLRTRLDYIHGECLNAIGPS